MAWIKLESNDNNLNSRTLKQFNEAFADARDAMIDYDIYNEAESKILTWIKNGLQKVCPSPEKIGDFMKKYAAKVDAKLSSCKDTMFVQAWNNLKNMVKNLNNEQANESFALYLESIGENIENEDSIYEEGWFDNVKTGVKAGWNAFKNAGKDDKKKNDNGEQAKQQQKKPSKKSSQEKQPQPDQPKQTNAKKPTKLGQLIQQNGWDQNTALKPENIKKIAANLKYNKEKVVPMVKKYFANNPDTGNAKQNTKNDKEQQGGKKKTILEFLKKHWKMITLILIVAIALTYGGPALAAKFLVGPTIKQACKLVGGKAGAVIGTVGAIGATMAMGMGGDADVDADVDTDVAADADADVDANDDTDLDTDGAESEQEIADVDDQGKENEFDTNGDQIDDLKLPQFKTKDEVMKSLWSKDVKNVVLHGKENGLSQQKITDIVTAHFKSKMGNCKNNVLKSQLNSMVRLMVNKHLNGV